MFEEMYGHLGDTIMDDEGSSSDRGSDDASTDRTAAWSNGASWDYKLAVTADTEVAASTAAASNCVVRRTRS